MYPAFIDPNLVRLFGYSSRNQKDKQAYLDILNLRMRAKHNEISEEEQKQLGVSSEDLKNGLKLPINAFTGCLRATFNPLYDPLQGISICFTGQLLLLQLAKDLQEVPTLEIVEMNTDAIEFFIDEEYKTIAVKILNEWQEYTGLELEEDVVVKVVARDVNNFAEILKTSNGYEVKYKGGEFKGEHKFEWNKEKKIFEYSFRDGVEVNSMTIVGEALLKNLLFDIPIEKTINECDDIFRFQKITHLGHTYEKCVQESPNGDIELQRNNRIYAGKIPSGIIVKVKSNGRRDSLADCPPNPIVDNANKCTIDDINKDWYIKYTRQKLNDFKGVKRLENYKKDELLELANKLGLEVDKKVKKDELIKMIEEIRDRNEEKTMKDIDYSNLNIYEKIKLMKREIREHDFVMDQAQASNLGGKEFASIGQYYNILHNLCDKYNLFFKWESNDAQEMIKDAFKPTGKMPMHVTTVGCQATFINIDNPEEEVRYKSIASGSDICDKGASGASTLAFRNWFDKNFTPKYLNTVEEELGGNEEQTSEPKIPTYIPPEKKEEIKEEVVNTIQKEDSDEDDIKEVINNIMKVRELTSNDAWGAKTLELLMGGELSTADILEINLKVNNKLDSLQGGE